MPHGMESQSRELAGADLRLRAILETAAEGIMTLDADGTLTSFNAAAAEIFGYPAEQVLGKNIGLLLPEEVSDRPDTFLAQYMSESEGTMAGTAREVRGRHRDGHRLALELSVSAVRVEDERFFTVILRDLRERKRFERNQAAQARLGTALLRAQTIPEIWAAVGAPLAYGFGFDVALLWLRSDEADTLECVGTWTLDEDRFGTLSSSVAGARCGADEGPAGEACVSGRALRVYDLSEARCDHHAAAVGAGLRSGVVLPVLGEKSTHGAVELLRVGPLRGDPSLLSTLESIGGSIGLAVERAHAILLAEASVKAREEFLAHMSHEIRTPLSAVIGLAYLLESAPLGDAERATVARLRYSAGVLRGLVNNVLDFAKLTAGQMELIPHEYPLVPLLTELTQSQAALAEEKGLVLRLEADPGLPETVFTDSIRLTQVLMNLIHNAIKFTEEGSVTLRAVPVGTRNGAAVVRLSVEDTGPGIAAAERDRIFEAYTQVRDRGASKAPGTGLGLAIVRRLVELLDGTLTLESTEGEGSTFHVTVPLEVVTQPTERADTGRQSADLSGLRILVADDSEMNRFVASRILGEAGADVITAEDGEEALVRVREGNYDLVLMDLQMPGMDGYAAAEAIRDSLDADAAPPVAALTARASVEDRQRVAASGMVDMITKPFNPDGLKERVALLAGRGSAPDTPEAAYVKPSRDVLIDDETLLTQAAGDPAFAVQILEMFQREASEILFRMDAVVSAGKTEGLDRLAHTLKSQAGTIGASSLQKALEALEHLTRVPSPDHETILEAGAGAVALGRAVLADIPRVEDLLEEHSP